MRRGGITRIILIVSVLVFCFFIVHFLRNTNTCQIASPNGKNENVDAIIELLKNEKLNEHLGRNDKSHSSTRDSSDSLFRGYDELPLSDLENTYIPNHIYYVWCYNSTIEFRHYLSILAAWKMMRPDSITFYTKYNITDNNEHYNFWLSELLVTISGFKLELMPPFWDGQEHGCGVWFAFAVLNDVGGIYFSDNLFPMKSLRFIRNNQFVVATTKTTKDISFIASTPKNERLKPFMKLYENADVSPPLVSGLHFCDSNMDITFSKYDSILCTHVGKILPVQIMHLNSSFGALARKVMYGYPNEITVKTLIPGYIPKIFHMVWYGQKAMDFTMYLCLRSILTIVKPDKVFIHGDGQLYGKYLDELKKDIRVVFVYREVPNHIYGKQIIYMQHRSDIIRADVLLKYGGIYSDWDVLWLKPIDELISTGFDTILNLDHMPRPGYPDSINLGVLMSKPGSHFIKHWQDSLVNYRSRDFYFNAIELPYKIFEKYPETVHIESHLQVMCYFLKCHPTFHPDFRNYNAPQPFNWTTDVYSIHFTHPDPPEYANETALRNGKGMFTDIANYILKQPFKSV